jgi:hypothetical protein
VTVPGPDTQAAPPEADSGSDSRPEPVRNAAALASALTTLAGVVLLVLVLTHRLTPEGSAILGPALAAAIPTVVGAASTLLTALHARGKVTPLSAPVSAAGVALVEAGEGVMDAVRRVRELPSRQTPGPDHAAPEG